MSQYRLKPTGGNVLIEPVSSPDTTSGGIALPASAARNYSEGVVIAVGPGYFDGGERVVPEVYEGDTVLYQAVNNNKLPEIDGKILISCHQIIAIKE